jgi:hypothetical protein
MQRMCVKLYQLQYSYMQLCRLLEATVHSSATQVTVYWCWATHLLSIRAALPGTACAQYRLSAALWLTLLQLTSARLRSLTLPTSRAARSCLTLRSCKYRVCNCWSFEGMSDQHCCSWLQLLSFTLVNLACYSSTAIFHVVWSWMHSSPQCTSVLTRCAIDICWAVAEQC